MTKQLTVCIESPLKGDLERNTKYARACMLHVLDLDGAPFASHLLYTQVLNDQDPEARRIGMEAGFSIGDQCNQRWFFTDLGMSEGMQAGWERALRREQLCVRYQLGDDWETEYDRQAEGTPFANLENGVGYVPEMPGPKIFPREVPQGSYYEGWNAETHTWELTDNVSEDIRDWADHVGPFIWRDPSPGPPDAHLAELAEYKGEQS
jgi:hypothetical protein